MFSTTTALTGTIHPSFTIVDGSGNTYTIHTDIALNPGTITVTANNRPYAGTLTISPAIKNITVVLTSVKTVPQFLATGNSTLNLITRTVGFGVATLSADVNVNATASYSPSKFTVTITPPYLPQKITTSMGAQQITFGTLQIIYTIQAGTVSTKIVTSISTNAPNPAETTVTLDNINQPITVVTSMELFGEKSFIIPVPSTLTASTQVQTTTSYPLTLTAGVPTTLSGIVFNINVPIAKVLAGSLQTFSVPTTVSTLAVELLTNQTVTTTMMTTMMTTMITTIATTTTGTGIPAPALLAVLGGLLFGKRALKEEG
jgi:hypothetical protein